MKVVLDTNCFISCIGKKSPFRDVFDSYLKKSYALCVSSEILLEYEEKFSVFWGEEVTTNLMGRILAGSNTLLYTIYYNFLLAQKDPDDNKFVDAYIVAGADWLVSNDKDLLALRGLGYPAINVITLQEFSDILRSKNMA
jgi:uncharacterized protein